MFLNSANPPTIQNNAIEIAFDKCRFLEELTLNSKTIKRADFKTLSHLKFIIS
jgi:hypothetical protein